MKQNSILLQWRQPVPQYINDIVAFYERKTCGIGDRYSQKTNEGPSIKKFMRLN